MDATFKFLKTVLNLLSLVILFIIAFLAISSMKISTAQNTVNTNYVSNIPPFSVNSNDVAFNNDIDTDDEINPKNNTENASEAVSSKTIQKTTYIAMSNTERENVISKAKEMAEVKWTPKYNMADEKGKYVFLKGKTYTGVPYTMDPYQVISADDFKNKITGSKVLYGNDCSGFVSAAWDIERQTTLSLYNALKNGTNVDGKAVIQLSWEDLQQGDALLLDNGKGKGHIMLFLSYDKQNSDNLIVYEQNIATSVPYEPLPVARKDTRSKKFLINEGYIPIRLMTKP